MPLRGACGAVKEMLIIPVFVPHEGCAHNCCFCNQNTISGQSAAPSVKEVRALIDSYLDILPNYEDVQVAFFGGSFTAIPEERQIAYLEAVLPYIERHVVHSIRISTRPDAIDAGILNLLRSHFVKTIELGAQSMDDSVLRQSGRGHTAEDTAIASALIRAYGFELGLQTMTGLPGASFESDLETADRIIALKPALVRIYPTIVIKGTPLHTMYERGAYTPPPLEKTVALCAELMVKYQAETIKVIRLGLQSSDAICADGEIAAGPYHPAFGQLVRSRIAYENLLEIGELQDGIFTASVPRRELSDYIGQKKCNVLAIKERFGCKKVRIKPIN